MKYILGGGITGLIYAFYNRDYKIITPEIGGQMKSSFSLGPRYLHDTHYSRQLLNDLNIDIVESKIKIGYLSNKGFVTPDNEFRKQYFMKSRNTNSLEHFDSSVMNSYKSEIDILKVDFNEIIEKLKTEVINEKVESVDLQSNLINNTIKFEHIISTMPINKLNLFDYNFQSFDMNYVQYKIFEDLQDYDYVYDIRTSTKFHRITKDSNFLICDYFNDVDIDTNNEYYINHTKLKNAQILSVDFVKDLSNIKFVGRYGTWNRKWKTESVIEDAIEFRNME